MDAQTLFVTGTDTGIGKTLICCALLRGLRARGCRAVGYKPVASGCQPTAGGLRNADALALQAASTRGWNYDAINPYAFESPIAPHLAAAETNQPVEPAVLNAGHQKLADKSDWVIVEGAGGWHVPLAGELDFGGWAGERQWPVLLVVGMRLGCINHALLSARAIAANTTLTGWIANVLPPVQDRLADNIESIKRRLGAPLRGLVDVNPGPDLHLYPNSHWLR